MTTAAAPSSAYAGTSHVLTAANDPTTNASAITAGSSLRSEPPPRGPSATFAASPTASAWKGSEMRCACRSAKRNVQNGNSVMLICPGIRRLLRQ